MEALFQNNIKATKYWMFIKLPFSKYLDKEIYVCESDSQFASYLEPIIQLKIIIRKSIQPLSDPTSHILYRSSLLKAIQAHKNNLISLMRLVAQILPFTHKPNTVLFTSSLFYQILQKNWHPYRNKFYNINYSSSLLLLSMKAPISSDFLPQKSNKTSEIVFRTNRPCDKFSHSFALKPSQASSNKEQYVAQLINSLHMLLNQDKPLPKDYVKKIIQILNQMQNKNNAFENCKVTDEKTPKKLAQIFNIQHTDDNSQGLSCLEPSNQVQRTRIRKVNVKKILENVVTEAKQNHTCQQLNILQKKFIDLELSLDAFKKAIQEKQSQVKEKDALISKFQQEKQLSEEAAAQALGQMSQNEGRLLAEKQQLCEDLRVVKGKVETLKSQLSARQAQILFYWIVDLKQRPQ